MHLNAVSLESCIVDMMFDAPDKGAIDRASQDELYGMLRERVNPRRSIPLSRYYEWMRLMEDVRHLLSKKFPDRAVKRPLRRRTGVPGRE